MENFDKAGDAGQVHRGPLERGAQRACAGSSTARKKKKESEVMGAVLRPGLREIKCLDGVSDCGAVSIRWVLAGLVSQRRYLACLSCTKYVGIHGS